MQALHLVFGLGAVFAPMIAEPFLLETGDIHAMENNATVSQPITNATGTAMPYVFNATEMEASYEEDGKSDVAIPYAIIGASEILIGLVLLSIFVKDGLHLRARKDNSPKEESPHCEQALKRLKMMRIAIILMIFVFYVLYCTIESEMGNFLVLFCVKFLGWSKSRSAVITAVFWMSFTISRGFGVFYVRFLKPQVILFSDLIVSLCGFFPLLFFIQYHDAVMWVCVVVAGAGVATIYATGITWTEQYIKVTESVGAVFGLGGAVSDLYGPLLFVYLMEHVTYMSYVYLQFAILCLLLVLMCVMQFMANTYLRWKEAVPVKEKGGEEGEEEFMNTS